MAMWEPPYVFWCLTTLSILSAWHYIAKRADVPLRNCSLTHSVTRRSLASPSDESWAKLCDKHLAASTKATDRRTQCVLVEEPEEGWSSGAFISYWICWRFRRPSLSTDPWHVAHEAGAAAEMAASRKEEKYVDLGARYICEPIAVETLGVFNASARHLLDDLGRRISLNSG